MNKNAKKALRLAPLAVIFALMLSAGDDTGCDDGDPAPDSDSSQDYESGSKIPVDDNVYTVSGEVIGPVNDVTRQVEPAQGSLSGYNSYTSGTFTGAVEEGKGFVRLLVQTADPATPYAQPTKVVIIKTTDTKVRALLTGDVVTFKCRLQYEALAAVKDGEKFDKDKVETWELDYCRLATPQITVK